VARHRIGGLAIIAACWAILAALAPRPEDRAPWLGLVALPLGYGHLLGGLVLARRASPPRPLSIAFWTTSVAALLAGYGWALARVEWLPYPMYAVSAWHIFENDIALGRARADRRGPGPVPRRPGPHLVAVALSAALAATLLGTPIGSTHAVRQLGWLPPSVPIAAVDLASALLMYHAVSWLWFLAERTRRLPRAEARRARARLAWVHLVPLGANAALYAAFPAAHRIVAAPSLYVFWSVLHAFETAWRRGLARRTPHRGPPR